MGSSLEIQNLKCGGCGGNITNRLGALEDVDDISVNVENSTLSFAHTMEFTFELLRQTLAKLVYPEVHERNTLARRIKSHLSCAIGKMGS